MSELFVWIIVAVVYIIGIVIAWHFTKKWDNPMSEKVWAAVLWICTLPLFVMTSGAKKL